MTALATPLPIPPTPSEADFAVQVRQVTKTFGVGDSRTVALKAVNFSTQEGELHLVVGPSGCGKTTLLSVVAGTLEWEEGEIEVFGHRPVSYTHLTLPTNREV